MGKPLFFNLIENCAAAKILERDILSNRVDHAYIFVSNDKLALFTLSKIFAAKCLNLKGEKLSLAYEGNNADIKIIPFEKETVLTADIDAISDTLYYRPSEGDKKFYIINYGETMNASCQNKLLKTLEDPPECVYFIINCTSVNNILPTIISRCKKIDIAPFSENYIKNALIEENKAADKVDLAVSLCRGNLESCRRILTEKKYIQVFETALVTLLSLQSSKNALSCASRLINYKDSLVDILDFFEIIFRDIMVCHNNLKDLVMLKGNMSDIDTLSAMYSLDAILDIMPKIAFAKERIKGHGNVNSIIDELIFNFAEVKNKYK